MRILVRMPNWLGDAVMATPALHNLLRHYEGAQFVLVGSRVVAELFAGDRRFAAVIADESGKARPRLAGLWRLARRLQRDHGPFDESWSFQNGFSSRLLLWAAGARRRVARRHHRWADWLLTDAIPCDLTRHHAEIYNGTVNGGLGTNHSTGPTALPPIRPHDYLRPTAGLHPGAAYGDAKRWLPERFAETAAALARQYDIVLFAGPDERELAEQVEALLIAGGVKNATNLGGRTSIRELVARIAGLDLFLANDSGPMHVAGALGVPTVAIFGSTDPRVTCPWSAQHTRIVRRELPCSPCHARTCPLHHHACMREITAEQVLAAARSLATPHRAAG